MASRLVDLLVAVPAMHHADMIHLLGGPYVTTGQRRFEVPEGSKRLLVFVALSTGKIERRRAAGALWPSGDEVRAAGNLRSALWRLRSAGINALTCDKQTLALRPGTLVDVDLVCEWAERVTDATVPTSELAALEWRTDALDLLPGWYDDWVLFERERVRQRLLHALEALSRRLLAADRYADAAEAALGAVRAEPLRESAQRTLLQVHLSEGNLGEAWRAFQQYRRLLAAELGVAPSADLTAMIERAVASRPQCKSKQAHLVSTGDRVPRTALASGNGRVMAVTEALGMRSRQARTS